MSNTILARLDLSPSRVHTNLAPAKLVEMAIARGEGVLASNGGLVALTDLGRATGGVVEPAPKTE